MFKLKKIVDERQELELLKIEHICFWVLYWMLLISIIVQSVFMQAPFKQYGVEFIVFMSVSALFLIVCIKKGAWDYYTKPSLKTYLITSLVGSVSFGLIIGIQKYNNYEQLRNSVFSVLVPMMFIMVLSMFILIFFTCFILGKLVIRKQHKLEKDFSDDN